MGYSVCVGFTCCYIQAIVGRDYASTFLISTHHDNRARMNDASTFLISTHHDNRARMNDCACVAD